MHQTFAITKNSRKSLSHFLNTTSLEKLNKIPEGFNNNIIWNIAHIVVVQQMLVYKLSGLPMLVSDEMVAKYMRGTKPLNDVTQSEIELIQSVLFETINKTEEDYNIGIFQNFQEFTSLSGFTMRNIEDALAFNYYHEAVHTGMIMSIMKFV
jgi:formate dehydrogenase maturation protein FdhE